MNNLARRHGSSSTTENFSDVINSSYSGSKRHAAAPQLHKKKQEKTNTKKSALRRKLPTSQGEILGDLKQQRRVKARDREILAAANKISRMRKDLDRPSNYGQISIAKAKARRANEDAKLGAKSKRRRLRFKHQVEKASQP
jgi:hypothetical protein